MPRSNSRARDRLSGQERNAEFLLHILKNPESNVKLKSVDIDCLVLEYIQLNKTPMMCQRTYRAHGHINPYMNLPCHT